MFTPKMFLHIFHTRRSKTQMSPGKMLHKGNFMHTDFKSLEGALTNGGHSSL